MSKNYSNIGLIQYLDNRNNYQIPKYETTYSSCYVNFTQKKEPKYNFSNNESMEYTTQCHLMCPDCINQKIILKKNLSKIKRYHLPDEEDSPYFDKLRIIYEDKRKSDIKRREDRSKSTYNSLFNNRGRSAENYKKLYEKDEKGEVFGKDINYGMLRCRKRELKNDKRLFGIKEKKIFGKKVKKYNCIIDKNEYSQIINKQIEEKTKENYNKKFCKLKDELLLLNEHKKNEKKTIKKEIDNLNNIRKEMDKVNSYLLLEKIKKKYHEEKIKKSEKENMNKLCQSLNEDYERKLKIKKKMNQKIMKENYEFMKKKIRDSGVEKIKITNQKYNSIILKGVEKQICETCNRKYPKNVLEQFCY